MDFKDIEQKDKEDLKVMLSEHQVLLRELRFKAREGQLKMVSQISKIRKEIAQIKTVLSNQS
jgi:ribosomal protein L29